MCQIYIKNDATPIKEVFDLKKYFSFSKIAREEKANTPIHVLITFSDPFQ